MAYAFIGGMLHSAEALSAIVTPTVNSFRRINAPVTSSGATWSPNTISYAGNNRTHMIRIPGGGRIELRLSDGAASPYLSAAAILETGLDGIDEKRDPGPRLEINAYQDRSKLEGLRHLPDNLFDALRALETNTVLTTRLGAEFTRSYLKLKRAEWRDYSSHVSTWEFARTIDC